MALAITKPPKNKKMISLRIAKQKNMFELLQMVLKS
jgi:hypothetical protein